MTVKELRKRLNDFPEKCNIEIALGDDYEEYLVIRGDYDVFIDDIFLGFAKNY